MSATNDGYREFSCYWVMQYFRCDLKEFFCLKQFLCFTMSHLKKRFFLPRLFVMKMWDNPRNIHKQTTFFVNVNSSNRLVWRETVIIVKFWLWTYFLFIFNDPLNSRSISFVGIHCKWKIDIYLMFFHPRIDVWHLKILNS